MKYYAFYPESGYTSLFSNSKISEATNKTISNFNVVFGSISQNLAMSEELASSADTLKNIAEDMNKLIN